MYPFSTVLNQFQHFYEPLELLWTSGTAPAIPHREVSPEGWPQVGPILLRVEPQKETPQCLALTLVLTPTVEVAGRSFDSFEGNHSGLKVIAYIS